MIIVLPSPRGSHPADGVLHLPIHAPRPEVVLMTDAAPQAAVSDDEGPITIATAFRPCADMDIVDDQPRWVDVSVWKPEPVCNDFEVPQDRVAQRLLAVVLPSAVNLRQAAANSVEQH